MACFGPEFEVVANTLRVKDRAAATGASSSTGLNGFGAVNPLVGASGSCTIANNGGLVMHCLATMVVVLSLTANDLSEIDGFGNGLLTVTAGGAGGTTLGATDNKVYGRVLGYTSGGTPRKSTFTYVKNYTFDINPSGTLTWVVTAGSQFDVLTTSGFHSVDASIGVIGSSL